MRAASPVIGGPARKMAKAAEKLQTELGVHHDAVEAGQWLRNEALAASASKSFVAGQLTTREQYRQEAVEDQWRKLWKALNRKKMRRWLD